MEEDFCHNLLNSEGFQLIGSLDCDFHMAIWWHPQDRIELAVVTLKAFVLLRASKCYRLTAWSPDGELFARDLGQLQSWLASHFSESHFWLSAFRDITPTMACRRIKEKNFRNTLNDESTETEDLREHLRQVSGESCCLQSAIQQDVDLFKLNHGKSSTLQQYLSDQLAMKRHRYEQLTTQKRTLSQQLATQNHLENQYMQKAEAVCLLFTICSNIQIAKKEEDFADILFSVVKEINDINRYEIKQKLQGGKLRIYTEEFDLPGVSLLSRWAHAVLNPRQLAKLGPDFEELSKSIEAEFMVLPTEDIILAGSVKDEKKLINARIIRNFLNKLELVPTRPTKTDSRPKSNMPVWIGNTSDDGTRIGSPWELPLEKMGHVYISGTTGAGKTFLAFAIVEGALTYPDLSIIVLTPNHQWVGLKCFEDRPEVLEKYKLFGLKPEQARGFNFKYYGIGQNIGESLPKDLRSLATGLHVLSFKYSDDQSRCEIGAKVLQSIFDARSCSESGKPQDLIIIDEAPRFTRKRVCKEAQSAAVKSEKAINLITAEGRKYGLSAILLSQTIRHFSYDLAAVRQNISTRIFMRNSDGEIDHASQFMDDGREILRLSTGEAFVCNQEWGCVKILVRPPLCKAWEPSDTEVKKLVSSTSEVEQVLSKEAQLILDTTCRQYYQTGQPVRLAAIFEQAGITSRRKLNRIVDELKEASAVKFEYLNERGKPLVIIPVDVYKTSINHI